MNKNKTLCNLKRNLKVAATSLILLLLLATQSLFGATTLYLRSDAVGGSAPGTAQTDDTFGPNMPTTADNYKLTLDSGTIEDTIEYMFTGSNNANSADDPVGYGEAGRFVSPPMAATILAATTNWTILLYGKGGAAAPAWALRACAYVWKADNSGKRGDVLLLSPDTWDGVATTASSQNLIPYSGLVRNNEPGTNAISVQNGDRLVVEVEWHLMRWSTSGRSAGILVDRSAALSRITCENGNLTFIPYLFNVNPSLAAVDQAISLEGALFGTPVAGDGIQLSNKWIPYNDPIVTWTDDTITISDPPDDLVAGNIYATAQGVNTNSVYMWVRPTLSTRDPTGRGQNASAQWITITGKSFFSGWTSDFGAGIIVSSDSYVSSTTAKCQISVLATAAQGARAVKITNPDGSATTQAGWFTVNYRPGEATGGDNLTVSPNARGANIVGSTITITDATGRFVSGCAVDFSASGVTVTDVIFDAGNQIRAVINISAAPTYGLGDITVTNPDAGKTTKTGCFTISPRPILEAPPVGASVVGLDTTPRAKLGRGAQNKWINVKGYSFQNNCTVNFSLPSDANGITVFSYDYTYLTEDPNRVRVQVSVGTSCPVGYMNFKIINPDAGYDAKIPLDSFFQITEKASVGGITAPASLSFGQGASNIILTVTGLNFVSGAEASFPEGGISVDWTTVLSAAELQCQIDIADAAAVGVLRDIKITNLDWGSDTLADQLQINYKPSFTTLAPAQIGQNASNVDIVINGANIQNGCAVEFLATIVNIGSYDYTHAPASITVTVNSDIAAATGVKDVSLLNPDYGYFASDWQPFTVNNRPVLSSVITEISGWADNALAQGAENQNARLNGDYFQAGLAIDDIVISTKSTGGFQDPNIIINSFNRVSATVIDLNLTVISTCATGGRYIKLTNPDYGMRVSALGIITITKKPTMSSVVSGTPNGNDMGQGAADKWITINGADFQSGCNVVVNSDLDVHVSSTYFISAAQIKIKTSIDSTAAIGGSTFTVTNPDAGKSKKAAYSFFHVTDKPGITSCSPDNYGQGAQGVNFTISGSVFSAGSAYTGGAGEGKIEFTGTGITITDATATDGGNISVTVNIDPAASPTGSARGITITNPDFGVNTAASLFTVNLKPLISSLSQTSRGQGAQGVEIVILGSNFNSALKKTDIWFSGGLIDVTTVTAVAVSGSSVTIRIDIGATASTTTARNLTVQNPDKGIYTKSPAFSVTLKPAVTSCDPNALGCGASGQTIIVTGSGFQTGCQAYFSVNASGDPKDTEISIGGVAGSGESLTLSNVIVYSSAALGGRYLVVINGDEGRGVSPGSVLSINMAPSVVNLSPNKLGQQATSKNVTINGSNFQSGIGIGDVIFTPNTGITKQEIVEIAGDGSYIIIKLTIAETAPTGLKDVKVTNPDKGSDTKTSGFQVSARPTFNLCAPDNRGAGASDEDIVIYGNNFVTGMNVYFGGGGITPYPVSAAPYGAGYPTAGVVTISISSTTSAPSTRSVKLENSDYGFTTVQDTFTVNQAPALTSASPSSRGQGASGQNILIKGLRFQSGITPADVTFSQGGGGISVTNISYHGTSSFTATINVSPTCTAALGNITVKNP
ncbi:MAG: hypothetical protein FP827_07800, partial [Candidatus Omnitrophica bacterium]|nr:hypothetical protein [Candidatus Omnitrophota bacterium]